MCVCACVSVCVCVCCVCVCVVCVVCVRERERDKKEERRGAEHTGVRSNSSNCVGLFGLGSDLRRPSRSTEVARSARGGWMRVWGRDADACARSSSPSHARSRPGDASPGRVAFAGGADLAGRRRGERMDFSPNGVGFSVCAIRGV